MKENESYDVLKSPEMEQKGPSRQMRRTLKRNKMPQRKRLKSESESEDLISDKNDANNYVSRKIRVKRRIRHISESDSENES